MDSLESSKKSSNDTGKHGLRSWFLPDMVPNHLFKGFIWVLCYCEMSQNPWWESWEFWSWAKIRFIMGGSRSIIEKKSLAVLSVGIAFIITAMCWFGISSSILFEPVWSFPERGGSILLWFIGCHLEKCMHFNRIASGTGCFQSYLVNDC